MPSMWFVLFIENGIIKSDKVFEVMLATDRCHYAKYNPYMDSPQSIGKSVSLKCSVLICVMVTAFVIDVQTYFEPS